MGDSRNLPDWFPKQPLQDLLEFLPWAKIFKSIISFSIDRRESQRSDLRVRLSGFMVLLLKSCRIPGKGLQASPSLSVLPFPTVIMKIKWLVRTWHSAQCQAHDKASINISFHYLVLISMPGSRLAAGAPGFIQWGWPSGSLCPGRSRGG